MIFPAINLPLVQGFSMAMLNNQMVYVILITAINGGILRHQREIERRKT